MLANDGNLSILRYVPRIDDTDTDNEVQFRGDLPDAWADFDAGSAAFWGELDEVLEMVNWRSVKRRIVSLVFSAYCLP